LGARAGFPLQSFFAAQRQKKDFRSIPGAHLFQAAWPGGDLGLVKQEVNHESGYDPADA
jgi:hypothetical protein